jgi:hypothetical protein
MPRSVKTNSPVRRFISFISPFKPRKNLGDKIRVRRSLLIIWGIAAAGLGWTVISSITFLLIKHKAGYREVHFSHVFLLPIKLDEYRKAKG